MGGINTVIIADDAPSGTGAIDWRAFSYEAAITAINEWAESSGRRVVVHISDSTRSSLTSTLNIGASASPQRQDLCHEIEISIYDGPRPVYRDIDKHSQSAINIIAACIDRIMFHDDHGFTIAWKMQEAGVRHCVVLTEDDYAHDEAREQGLDIQIMLKPDYLRANQNEKFRELVGFFKRAVEDALTIASGRKSAEIPSMICSVE